MNDYALIERETLEKMKSNWEKQGFEVITEYNKLKQYNFFTNNYIPDAILLKENDNVIVEIIRKFSPSTDTKLEKIKTFISEKDGWRFQVVYAGVESTIINKTSYISILNTIEEAKILEETNERASLLLYWAIFEAIARHIFPKRTTKPQSPARVIELLASSGNITPSEAKLLRELIKVRNQLIHGALEEEVDELKLTKMHHISIDLTKSLSQRDQFEK